MSNFWCDIITVIIGFILSGLSFIDAITKKSFANKSKIFRDLLATLKKATAKSIIIVALIVIALFTTRQKDQNNELEKEIASKAFQRELDRRDSVNQHNFQENLKKTSSASSSANAETMAKYFLLYDSVQHKIEKIVRDSSKRIITATSYGDIKPEFDISDIKLSQSHNDTIGFHITLTCKKTAIENLNLKLQLYFLKQGNFIYSAQTQNFIPRNTYMASNTSSVAENINITALKNMFQAFFHIYGTYEYNGKKVPVDFILFYNFRDSTFGIPGIKDYLITLFNEQL